MKAPPCPHTSRSGSTATLLYPDGANHLADSRAAPPYKRPRVRDMQVPFYIKVGWSGLPSCYVIKEVESRGVWRKRWQATVTEIRSQIQAHPRVPTAFVVQY